MGGIGLIGSILIPANLRCTVDIYKMEKTIISTKVINNEREKNVDFGNCPKEKI